MRRGFLGAAPPKRAETPPEPRGDPEDGLGFDRAFERALLAQEAGRATEASSSSSSDRTLGVTLRSSAANAASLDGALTRHWPHGHVIVPSADGHADNLMLMLHGRGDVPAPFAKLARSMALPRTCCVALQGPHPIPFVDDGRAWFTFMDQESFEPIDGSDPTDTRRVDSLDRVVTRLANLIDALTDADADDAAPTPTWPRSRVHLFGFSDGGTVALTAAMRAYAEGKGRLGGCATVCASLLPEQIRTLSKVASGTHDGSTSGDDGSSNDGSSGDPTPVTLTAGESDRVVSVSSVRETADVLIDANPGHVASVHATPGKGHAMVGGERGEGEMRHLMEFWSLTLWRPREVGGGGGGTEAGDFGDGVVEVDGTNVRVGKVVLEEEDGSEEEEKEDGGDEEEDGDDDPYALD